MAVADYKNRFYKVGDQKMTLSRPMLSAINQLMADFQQATGKDDMILTSGYRSLKDQNDALQEKINEFGKKEALKWAMLPGYSEHHTGYAVDMSIYTDEELYIPYKGQDEYAWINQNCFKYGIVRRYTEDKVAITGIGNEPWHYRYVGIPHAYLMTVKDLCLEEYIDYLRQFSFQGEHLRLATEEGNFEIYYVAAAPKGKTHLPVPKDTPYTVSGNNVDGFIITTYET